MTQFRAADFIYSSNNSKFIVFFVQIIKNNSIYKQSCARNIDKLIKML